MVANSAESSKVLCCDWGIGAPDRIQHDFSDALRTGASLLFIFMLSHWDCVWGVAHSANLEVRNAHSERGIVPSPARLSASAKMSDRRITIQVYHTGLLRGLELRLLPLTTEYSEINHARK